MIEQIGLDSWTARFGNSMYDFYLNLLFKSDADALIDEDEIKDDLFNIVLKKI